MTELSSTVRSTIPASVSTSARLNAMTADSRSTTIGFGIPRSQPRAEIPFPAAPAASIPAASATNAEGTRVSARQPSATTTESATQAGPRGW